MKQKALQFRLINNRDYTLVDAFGAGLHDAVECNLAVSYIRSSGLNLILNALEVFAKKHAVRVLTSAQTAITEIDAVKTLLELGADVRALVDTPPFFHPKLYIFKGLNVTDYIVGSANISRSAFTEGTELGIHFPRTICPEIDAEFERLWKDPNATVTTLKNVDRVFKKGRLVSRIGELEDGYSGPVPGNLFATQTAFYSVTKKADDSSSWKFNLSVQEITKRSDTPYYVIVRCDYSSPSERIFAIPSPILEKHVFPYANQDNTPRYLFDVSKKTLNFNWQRSVKLPGEKYLLSAEDIERLKQIGKLA